MPKELNEKWKDMSKKQLKRRIRELEAENETLRLLAVSTYPIYIYLYRDIPYNPYLLPYRFQPAPIYDWSPTWVGAGTTEIIGDVQVYGKPWIASGTSVADSSNVDCRDWMV
ncbi:hypothetical protein LCGC14_3045520 [marine sediment metagenome]|uniref:Uncharacterized protein n=1 Tax=marine sediment metagenome TaxID=412755 RepID=A0A0F8WNP4_9ZZZZ